MTEWSVTLGVLLNLLAYEVIGLSAGGMITPGYLALFWDQPVRIVATLGLALVTWGVVIFGVKRWILLYGRRRYGAMLVVGMAATWILSGIAPSLSPAFGDIRAIGFIVTGLIANEMETQGILPTMLVTLALTALVRIILVLMAGGSLTWPF